MHSPDGQTARPGRRRRAPGRALRLLALASLAALAAASASLAARHPVSAHWVPRSEPKKGIELVLRGERVIFKGDELHLEVELLDDEHRALFLESAGITGADPFHSDVFGRPVFTFLIRLENLAEAEIGMRPLSFFLITKGPVSYTYPCDLECLQAASTRAGLESADTKKLLRAVLDQSQSLKPGERLSKLLVFHRAPEKFKEFRLDLDGFTLKAANLRFVVPYAVPKKADAASGERK
jgi:hypothetical protein